MENYNWPLWRKSIPTKIRCMRRVSVNFESNGNRRYPNYMPLGSLYYPGYAATQEHKFEQMDEHMGGTNLVYGLSSQEIPMKQSFETNLCRDLTCDNNNCVSEETINSLKSVIKTLECNRSEGQGSLYSGDGGDRMDSGASLDGKRSLFSLRDREGRGRGSVTFADGGSERGSQCTCCPKISGNQQLDTLTNLVRQTLCKLDNYMALQAQQLGNQYNLEPYLLPEVPVNVPPCMDPCMNARQQQQPPKGRGARRTVKVMPVQPLVIMPAAAPPPTAPAAAAPAPAPPVYRPERYRMRFRRSGGATKTKQTKRDSGTTMWCPSRCCQCFCGVNASEGREFKSFTQSMPSGPLLQGGYCSDYLTPSESPSPDTGLTASLSSSQATSFSPSNATSCTRSYCPSQATSFTPSLSHSQATSFSPSQATCCTPTLCPSCLSASHASTHTPSSTPSLYCAAKKIMRSSGGMRSQLQDYDYHNEEEEEEQVQDQEQDQPDTETEMGADSQEEDDWYEHTQSDLDEPKVQPRNYSKITCDKLLQTDSYDTTSTDNTTDTDKDTDSSQTTQRFIATTDKAVNTSGDERKPVKIVRIYKCSTLKSKSKKSQNKGENKVRFLGKDVAKPNRSRDRSKDRSRDNPFLIQNKEELATKTNQRTSSTQPSLSKFRVLKTMSESTPDPPRRRYSVQAEAKFQRLLEEEHEKLKVPKDFDCRPLRCTCSRHSRCTGGCDRNVELPPTYPSVWSQVSMGD